jgi:hypothetical protein
MRAVTVGWFPLASHYICGFMGVWSDERVLAIISRAEAIAASKAYLDYTCVRTEDVDRAIREVK